LAVVGPFSSLHSKPCLSSPVKLLQSSLVNRAVGHFSLTTFSTYTALSTLFGWLWMRVGCAACQGVCDLVGHFSLQVF
jgi:hypothetical protein